MHLEFNFTSRAFAKCMRQPILYYFATQQTNQKHENLRKPRKKHYEK